MRNADPSRIDCYGVLTIGTGSFATALAWIKVQKNPRSSSAAISGLTCQIQPRGHRKHTRAIQKLKLTDAPTAIFKTPQHERLIR